MSEESIALLEPINIDGSSEAYLYLLGIGAPLSVSPLEAGQLALAEIRRAEAGYDDIENFEYSDNLIDEPDLMIPELDVFCSFREPNCFATIFNSTKLSSQTWLKLLSL